MKKNTLKFLCIIFIISQLPFSGFAQGCVEASSDEGPQLVGYIQPQFNAYFFGSKDNGDAIKPNTFLFKRARIGVVGSYSLRYQLLCNG